LRKQRQHTRYNMLINEPSLRRRHILARRGVKTQVIEMNRAKRGLAASVGFLIVEVSGKQPA